MHWKQLGLSVGSEQCDVGYVSFIRFLVASRNFVPQLLCFFFWPLKFFNQATHIQAQLHLHSQFVTIAHSQLKPTPSRTLPCFHATSRCSWLPPSTSKRHSITTQLAPLQPCPTSITEGSKPHPKSKVNPQCNSKHLTFSFSFCLSNFKCLPFNHLDRLISILKLFVSCNSLCYSLLKFVLFSQLQT